MADLKWALNEIRAQRRKALVSYTLMVPCLAAAIVCGVNWYVSDIRLDNAKANEERLSIQSTNLTSAVAYALDGRQYESEKNGRLEAEKNKAWGRLGPMQRTINDQQETIDKLSDWVQGGFTGEIDMRPRK